VNALMHHEADNNGPVTQNTRSATTSASLKRVDLTASTHPGLRSAGMLSPARSRLVFTLVRSEKGPRGTPKSNVTQLMEGHLGDPPSPEVTNRHMAVACRHLAEQSHDNRRERDMSGNDFAIPVAPTRGTLSC